MGYAKRDGNGVGIMYIPIKHNTPIWVQYPCPTPTRVWTHVEHAIWRVQLIYVYFYKSDTRVPLVEHSMSLIRHT